MKKLDTRAFTIVEGLLIVLVVSVIGFGSYYVYNSAKSKDKQTAQVSPTETPTSTSTPTSQPTPTPVPDETSTWESDTLSPDKFDITFKYPPSWTKEKIGDSTYGAVTLKAPDDFTILMSVNTAPRGYESPPDYVVLKVEKIDETHALIITDDAAGMVRRMYIGTSDIALGTKILPIANVGKDGANIEIVGYYTDAQSFSDFESKPSVQQAEKILKSLVFNR